MCSFYDRSIVLLSFYDRTRESEREKECVMVCRESEGKRENKSACHGVCVPGETAPPRESREGIHTHTHTHTHSHSHTHTHMYVCTYICIYVRAIRGHLRAIRGHLPARSSSMANRRRVYACNGTRGTHACNVGLYYRDTRMQRSKVALAPNVLVRYTHQRNTSTIHASNVTLDAWNTSTFACNVRTSGHERGISALKRKSPENALLHIQHTHPVTHASCYTRIQRIRLDAKKKRLTIFPNRKCL